MKKDEDKKGIVKETGSKDKTTDSKKSVIKKKKVNKNKLSKEQVKSVKKQLKEAKGSVQSAYKPASFSLIEVVVIILITGIIVSICSGLIVFNNYDKFVTNEASENAKLSEFIESYNHIMNSYVEEVDGEKLLDAAISAMYNYLGDSFSGYMDETTSEELQEQLNGEYEGVGIQITSDDKNITITKIFSNSPAEKAGLKVGDIIIKVDGDDYSGKTASDLSNLIKKGDKDTFVITYLRNGKENTVTVSRTKVYIDSVNVDVVDGIGYMQVETFSATTMEQVKSKLDGFESNIKSIVIDLRNNTGGYLSSAYETADLFVEKGKMIYKLKNKEGKITNYPAKEEAYRKFDNIVVLINEGTASAAEILAAALDESVGAILVGQKSFGKGTVQDTEVLSSGAMIKYTSSYWLTPNGNSINNIGITPDYEVENTEENDEQLEKAFDLLKK